MRQKYDPSMDRVLPKRKRGCPATPEQLDSQPLSHHISSIGTFFRRDKGGRGDVDDIGSQFFSDSYWLTIKGEFSKFIKGIIRGVYKRCFTRLSHVKGRVIKLERLVADPTITADEFREKARSLILGRL